MRRFDVYVTIPDTVAWFGPVTVSRCGQRRPRCHQQANMPPVIINLTNEHSLRQHQYGRLGLFIITRIYTVPPVAGVLFEVTGAAVRFTLVARYGLPLPSLSSYDYLSANPGLADEHIFCGDEFHAGIFDQRRLVSVRRSTFSAVASLIPLWPRILLNILPPGVPCFPTSTDVFTNIETTLFTTNCWRRIRTLRRCR